MLYARGACGEMPAGCRLQKACGVDRSALSVRPAFSLLMSVDIIQGVKVGVDF